MGSRTDKRPYDLRDNHAGLGDDGREKRQRTPAFANVVQEAVKVDSVQKLAQQLEPMLRRIVSEEIEKAFAQRQPQLHIAPQPALAPTSSGGPQLRLAFVNKLSLPLYTGSRVEAEDGSPLCVVLQDARTGEPVTSGPAAHCQLAVVVLEGDFNIDEDENWSAETFEQNIVRERDGKRPLLTGEALLCFKAGEGTIGEITFTDNSSWIRSRKFRLGVRINAGADGVRVREAKTEAFTVKDHRGELYKKHYPPALQDEVWRLDRIGKDGAFHKRLNAASITTVEDFLRMVVMDPQKLRNILGSGMSNKMWEGTVEHAKTCVLNGKLHVYYADESQGVGVIFNNIFQLMGLIADGQYMSVDALSDNEKVYVDKLVKVAYENWDDVVEYDGEALIGFKPNNVRALDPPQPQQQQQQPRGYPATAPRSGGAERTVSIGAENQASHGPPPSTPVDAPTAQSFMSPGPRHPAPFSDSANSDLSSGPPSSRGGLPSHLDEPPYQQLTEAGAILDDMSRAFQMARGLRPASGGLSLEAGHAEPHHSHRLFDVPLASDPLSIMSPAAHANAGDAHTSGASGGQTNISTELSGLFEDEAERLKAAELVETEDMQAQIQNLLRMFNEGTTSPGALTTDLAQAGFGLDLEKQLKDLGLVQEPGEGEPAEKVKLNGAHVGWLKLKAALRWAIFVRKRAAERRAQLEGSRRDV